MQIVPIAIADRTYVLREICEREFLTNYSISTLELDIVSFLSRHIHTRFVYKCFHHDHVH